MGTAWAGFTNDRVKTRNINKDRRHGDTDLLSPAQHSANVSHNRSSAQLEVSRNVTESAIVWIFSISTISTGQ